MSHDRRDRGRARRGRAHRGGDRPLRRRRRRAARPGDDAAVLAAPDAAGGGHAPTCSSRAGTSAGTGPRRPTSGVRAAAANLADIAAMGAVPTALLVGLAVPPDLDSQWVLDLADGLARGGRRGRAPSSSAVTWSVANTVTIAVTALGDLQGRDPVTRAGARPGDLVAVAGRLGWAAAGLRGALAAGSARRGCWSTRTAGRRRRTTRDRGPPTSGRPRWSTSATAWSPTSATSPPPAASACAWIATRSSCRRSSPTPRGRSTPTRSSGCSPAATTTPWSRPSPPDVDLPMAWSVVGRVDAGEGVLVDGAPWPGPPGWRSF